MAEMAAPDSARLSPAMTLTAGTRLGPYEIVAPLGVGGMGEVYRARDTKLNRDVAIKVLPEEFASDADRLARFTREAQVLASLNHPNIAAIYGIEERALVMELVGGEDLSQHVTRGPLALSDTLAIAKQIADALETAHEAGIVHRDLKPANIKVRPDGTVKVLDFGLAKATDRTLDSGPGTQDAQNSPTMTARATQMGMIIGTAAYMAPEQAKGKIVDKRADIWAFGVVLHEMLTGRTLFAADTIAETLARVIERQPDLSALPAETPARLRALIARCLERDPKRRLRDIGEARLMLESATLADPVPASAPAVAPRSRSLAWVGITVAAAAITGVIVWQARAPQPQPEERLVMLPPTDAPPQAVSISPDASRVAILADDKVWLRKFSEFTATEVAGSEGAKTVFWSPDGTHLGFQSRAQLWRVSVSGGAPIAIGPVAQDFTGAGGVTWRASGNIGFNTGTSTLMEMPSSGGEPSRALFTLDPTHEVDVHDASALPGDKGVLMVLHSTTGTRTIEVFDGTERKTVFTNSGTGRISRPVYAPSGHILFDMSGGVWAVPFSLASLATTGDPVLVADGARWPSVSSDGTIVMLSGTASTAVRPMWVDESGKVGAAITGQRSVSPRISPDGRSVAATVGFGADSDIWVFDLARGSERRLTFEPGEDAFPTWSPDGKFIMYRCAEAMCARPADGSGARVELLAWSSGVAVVAPDGRRLLLQGPRTEASGLSYVDMGPMGLTAPITAKPTQFISARVPGVFDLSPDGRFVAYESKDGGSDAVFVTQFPDGRGKWEIPVRLATEPRWSANGDRLFVLDELARLVEVPVDLKGAFTAGKPQIRIAVPGFERGAGFDRTKDGKSFLIPLPPSATGTHTRVLVIKNWLR